MDTLLAKLTNLSYELFGIFLPGLVASTFLCAWWFVLGPLAPYWTHGSVPTLVISDGLALLDSASSAGLGAVCVPILMVIYFMGHLVHWLARSGKAFESKPTNVARVWSALCFRIPKPGRPFDSRHERIFKFIQEKFSPEGELEWGQLFTVLKTYLLRHSTHSLVTTYQNKYTLHRAVTAAAGGWFWLNVTAAIAGVVTSSLGGPPTPWFGIALSAISALVLVWGFSDSYLYHWTNFGNSIVTETYALLVEGKIDENQKSN